MLKRLPYTGIKSVNLETPEPVLKVVSKTLVRGIYLLFTVKSPTGANLKWPPRFQSSSLPNIEALSNLGRQNQSIDPCRDIRAEDRISLISP